MDMRQFLEQMGISAWLAASSSRVRGAISKFSGDAVRIAWGGFLIKASGWPLRSGKISMFHKTKAGLMPLLTFAMTASFANAQAPDLDFLNHNQPLVDAHNCYP